MDIAERLTKEKLTPQEILDLKTSQLVGVVATAQIIGIQAATGGNDRIPAALRDNIEACAAELDERVPTRG